MSSQGRSRRHPLEGVKLIVGRQGARLCGSQSTPPRSYSRASLGGTDGGKHSAASLTAKPKGRDAATEWATTFRGAGSQRGSSRLRRAFPARSAPRHGTAPAARGAPAPAVHSGACAGTAPGSCAEQLRPAITPLHSGPAAFGGARGRPAGQRWESRSTPAPLPAPRRGDLGQGSPGGLQAPGRGGNGGGPT